MALLDLTRSTRVIPNSYSQAEEYKRFSSILKKDFTFRPPNTGLSIQPSGLDTFEHTAEEK